MVTQSKRLDLTLVICTYNRAHYLEKCLDSVYNQTLPNEYLHVLVVDNASTDDTRDKLRKYVERSNFHVSVETRQGLSHARNRALWEVETKWIAFVDDDVVLPRSYIDTLAKVLQHTPHACIGGPVKPIFSKTSADWVQHYFNTKSYFGRVASTLTHDSLSGANLVVQTRPLREIGGFDRELGMRGDEVGYGEDDMIQHALRDRGLTIGYYPELEICHHVLPKREKVSWHLNTAYKHGYYSQITQSQGGLLSWIAANLRTTIAAVFKHIPLNLLKLLREQRYTWQNMCIDSLSPMLFNMGGLVSHLRKIF